MDHLQWAYPYDALGVRQPFDAMPRKLSKLADDPCRGLAAQVRDAGGYAKDPAAFAEFLWADFLRRRVPAQVSTESPKSALARALDLSHGPQPEHLPVGAGRRRTERTTLPRVIGFVLAWRGSRQTTFNGEPLQSEMDSARSLQ